MSANEQNEQNDWNDSLDFEALADEQEGLEAAPVVDEVDEDGFEEEFGEAEPAPEETAAEISPTVMPPRRRAGISGTGLGVLFAFSILVAGAGIGGALLTALGVDPASLWQPEGFSQFDQLLNLDRNPLNLVYIVVLATLLLTMLGAWAVARAVRRVGDRVVKEGSLLEKVAALRIDEERGWQDQELKRHPALSTFVDENVGAWRLTEARQKRSAGLDGELQKLTRAAAGDDRDTLAGSYDHPTVGSLADEVVRLVDERESARREVEAVRLKDREQAEVVVRGIADAAGWNLSFTDQVGVQNAAATGLESRLQDLATSLAEGSASGGSEEIRAVVAQLRQDLRKAVHPAAQDGGDPLAEFLGMVERATKLAFQIAMEVARLGPRGERLLPMTQTLEELTTGFREIADRLGGPESDQSEELVAWDRQLATLQEQLSGADPQLGNVARSLQDLVSVANQLTGRLGALANGFDHQTERLRETGEACAALTGIPFDLQQAPTESAPAGDGEDLGLTRFDPFSGSEEEADGELVAVDPFATGTEAEDDAPAAPEEAPPSQPSAPTVNDVPLDEAVAPPPPEPVAVIRPEPVAVTPPEPVAQMPELVPDTPPEPVAVTPPEPVAPPPEPIAATPPEPVPPVPAAEPEGVLDLKEFDAVRVDEEPPAAQPPAAVDDVHELAEFGAVRLG